MTENITSASTEEPILFKTPPLRDWSKSIGVGGPEQRGGGSSVFEPLVRGGSFNFQLPLRGGSSCFFYGD